MHARDRGVSLIELMLALAILAVLLPMAVPGFARLRAVNGVSAASNTVLAAITLARSQAIGSGRPVILCPSSDGSRCTGGSDWSGGLLVFIDQNRDRAVDAGERVLEVVQAASLGGVRVLGSRGRPRIVYRADGRADGSNLSLRLCAGDGRLYRRIVIGNSGRARVEQTEADTPCA